MSTDMVTVTTLASIAKESNYKIDDNSLAYVLKCYETGMIRVLKEIAEDFLRNNTEILSSDYTKRLNNIATERRNDLKCTFNAMDFELVKEYEDAMIAACAGDVEDHYIQGFLDGYRYLANKVYFNREMQEEGQF